jgi:hypothetical protein
MSGVKICGAWEAKGAKAMVVWVAAAEEGLGEPTWKPVTMRPARSAAWMPLLARKEMVRVR